MEWMHNEVKSVDDRNRAKPSQFSRPRIPATAPAKQDDMNLTVVSDEFAWTFAG
jgi:hypothetical protein